jgi:hypothetical protein
MLPVTRGGTLSIDKIKFLDSFTSNKGPRILDPHIILQALRSNLQYKQRLSTLKLSFNDLNEYTKLVKTQGLKEVKQNLTAAPVSVPKTKQIIVHNLPPPPPSPPGRLRKMASFLKDKITKTFKKNSAPPVPDLLIPPQATTSVRESRPPIGYVAPATSRDKSSKTKKHMRIGSATLSSAQRPSLSVSHSPVIVNTASTSPRTVTTTSVKTVSSRRSSSQSPKHGSHRLDAREVARKLGHKSSSESSFSKSEKADRDSEKLRTGAPALYAVIKGTQFIKEGAKKGLSALYRKTGETLKNVGKKGAESFRATRKKVGDKYDTWRKRRAEAKRSEALKKIAKSPSGRASSASRASVLVPSLPSPLTPLKISGPPNKSLPQLPSPRIPLKISGPPNKSLPQLPSPRIPLKISGPPNKSLPQLPSPPLPSFPESSSSQSEASVLIPSLSPRVSRSQSRSLSSRSPSPAASVLRLSSRSRSPAASVLRLSSRSRSPAASVLRLSSRSRSPAASVLRLSSRSRSPAASRSSSASRRSSRSRSPAASRSSSASRRSSRSRSPAASILRRSSASRSQSQAIPVISSSSSSASPADSQKGFFKKKLSLLRARLHGVKGHSSYESRRSRAIEKARARGVLAPSPKKGLFANVTAKFKGALAGPTRDTGIKGSQLLRRNSSESSNSSHGTITAAAPTLLDRSRRFVSRVGKIFSRKKLNSPSRGVQGSSVLAKRLSSSRKSSSRNERSVSRSPAPRASHVAVSNSTSSSSDGNKKRKKINFKINPVGAIFGPAAKKALPITLIPVVSRAPSPVSLSSSSSLSLPATSSSSLSLPATSSSSLSLPATSSSSLSLPATPPPPPPPLSRLPPPSNFRSIKTHKAAAAAVEQPLSQPLNRPQSPPLLQSSTARKALEERLARINRDSYSHSDLETNDNISAKAVQAYLPDLPNPNMSAKTRQHRLPLKKRKQTRKLFINKLTELNQQIELEKQLKTETRRKERLQKYQRLVAAGKKKEAARYKRKHGILTEVIDISRIVPTEDLDLEVVDINQLYSSPKKLSSSGSRKRASVKQGSSPHSRKAGKSPIKMALSQQPPILPFPWKEVKTTNGTIYYVNTETNEQVLPFFDKTTGKTTLVNAAAEIRPKLDSGLQPVNSQGSIAVLPPAVVAKGSPSPKPFKSARFGLKDTQTAIAAMANAFANKNMKAVEQLHKRRVRDISPIFNQPDATTNAAVRGVALNKRNPLQIMFNIDPSKVVEV